METISATRTRRLRLAGADRLVAGLFLGVVLALAVPSTTWAQNHQRVPQPSAGQQPRIPGSETTVDVGYRYRGALSHLLHDGSGQTQSQSLPPPPPSAPHRSSKPPL
jgi:hypothetical protein